VALIIKSGRTSRRSMLKASALAALPLLSPSFIDIVPNQEPITANGGSDPYPIPWLDKNGSHNQPAGPNLEPSHIYHFQGKVARCSTFTGMGTDNQGNRIAFGSPTTDYGVNAARNSHPHMTHAVPGTGCPRESDPRFSPAHFAIRTLLGRSCSGRRSQHQSRRRHFHT